MTLTLDISPEAEAALNRSASLAGKPVSDYAAELLEDAALKAAEHDGQPADMIEHLRRIGVIGAVRSTPRADGQPWSEIEAASDPH